MSLAKSFWTQICFINTFVTRVGPQETQTICIGPQEIHTNCIGSQEIHTNCIGSQEIQTDCIGPLETQTNCIGPQETQTNCIGPQETQTNCIRKATRTKTKCFKVCSLPSSAYVYSGGLFEFQTFCLMLGNSSGHWCLDLQICTIFCGVSLVLSEYFDVN